MTNKMLGLISGFELFYLELRSQFPIIPTPRSLAEPVFQVEKGEVWVRKERRYEDHRAEEGKGEGERGAKRACTISPLNCEFEIITGQPWSCRSMPAPGVLLFGLPHSRRRRQTLERALCLPCASLVALPCLDFNRGVQEASISSSTNHFIRIL